MTQAPTPGPLSAEDVKRVFGLDPDAVGNRNRGWRIVDEGESNDLRAFNGSQVPAGSLAVHTRDGASNPISAEACKLPNFIGTVQDDYDSTYRDYFYAPLAAPTAPVEASGSGRVVGTIAHVSNGRSELPELIAAALCPQPSGETREWITGDDLHEIMTTFEERADVSEIAAKINERISARPLALGGQHSGGEAEQ